MYWYLLMVPSQVGRLSEEVPEKESKGIENKDHSLVVKTQQTQGI